MPRSLSVILLLSAILSNGYGVSVSQAQLANTKIVYTSARDGNYQIYTMNSDGTHQTRLTNTAAQDRYAKWSPDGSKIAFTSNRDGTNGIHEENNEIYVMNSDGTNQTRLTNNSVSDESPVWSPDGTKMAFVSYRDGEAEIFVMNANGANPIQLTENGRDDGGPAWSPDGTKIVFYSNRDGFVSTVRLYVMNADGSSETPLTNTSASDARDLHSAWSPDGTKIAFSSSRIGPNTQLYVMNADGTNITQITNYAADSYPVSWAPDGTKIVFASNKDGVNSIYVINPDGTNVTRLTNTPPDGDGSPSWSPFLPTFQLSTTTVQAGTVTKGSSGTATFTVTNAGSATLSVSDITSNNTQFDATPTSFSVTAGDSEVVTVTFTPSTVGWEQGTLVLTHNASGSPDTIIANGIGRITSPTGSLSDTKIAFYSNRDGNNEVYVMNADGTNQTRLTTNAASDASPSWSPDRTKIVFESSRTGDDIYVMNADGTNQTRLTNNSAGNIFPAWSPDGTKIAFWSERDGNREIYIMNPDGTDQTRLTNNSANDAYSSWSPDGTKIVFVSDRDGNIEIYVMDANGTSQTRLTTNAASDADPSWSPDGTKIAFRSERDGNLEIYAMNADGTNPTRLTTNTASDQSPSWSPDGTTIVFSSNRDGNQEIYVMNADGTNPTRLTNNAGIDDSPIWSPFPPPFLHLSSTTVNVGTVTKGSVGNVAFSVTNSGGDSLSVSNISSNNTQFAATPTSFSLSAGDSQLVTVTFTPTKVGWEQGTFVITHNASGSPDTVLANGIGRVDPPNGSLSDTKIAFTSERNGNADIYTMDSDGAHQTQLTTNSAQDYLPRWSPDRTKIAFVRSGGNSTIYVMNADGTNAVQLTSPSNSSTEPVWSPDGTRIAFSSNRDGTGDIYIMQANGSSQTRLTFSAGNGGPDWSPDGTRIAFYHGHYQIYVINTDGTNETPLTSGSISNFKPNWSPDGAKIAFVSYPNGQLDGNSEIYTMKADGTGITRLTDNSADDSGPSWSPDGTKIAFYSKRDGAYGVYVMNADGTSPLLLTPSLDYDPSWSPFPPAAPQLAATLSLRPVFGEPGATVSLPITLSNPNTTPVGGLEWQMIRGSTAIQFDSLMTLVSGFTASTNTLQDTTFVLFHSPNGAVIAPGTTTIGTLRYRINADAPLCTPLPLIIRSLVIGDSLGAALPDSTVNGEIQAGIPGDLNLDRKISILDIIKLVRVIVGEDPEPDSTTCPFFIADFNSDDDLNILDVIGQVNNILHLTKQITAPVPTIAVIRLSAAQAGPSGGLVVPVEVQSDGLVAGLQATVRFDPSTVSVGIPLLAGSATVLTLEASVQPGVLRFVVFGLQPGQGITAGTNVVLLIPITLRDGSAETPLLTLSNVVMASSHAQRVPVTIGAPVKAAALPTAFSLGAARPNPFNPSTQIAYDVPQQAPISLTVYNLLGQEVVRLVDGTQAPGRYTVTWNGRNAQGIAVASGVYVYRMVTGTGFTATGRMALLK